MTLLIRLLLTDLLMKLSSQLFTGPLTKCLFYELTGLSTLTAYKAFGLDLGLSFGAMIISMVLFIRSLLL